MPDRYSFGLGPRNPIGDVEDVEHVEWLVLEIGRRVQYVSGPRTSCGVVMWLWCIWTEELGHLGDVYISNLRVSQFAVFW